MLVIAVIAILAGIIAMTTLAGDRGVRYGRDLFTIAVLRAHRKRRSRSMTSARFRRIRHTLGAPVATGCAGLAAMALTIMPLRGATIPFAPGTNFWTSLAQSSALAAGCGLAIGVYISARRLAERRAHMNGRAPQYQRPAIIADLFRSSNTTP